MRYFNLLMLAGISLLPSCQKQEAVRGGMPEPVLTTTHYYNTANARLNDEISLGRALFYDERMAVARGASCGNCHRPEQSFHADAASLNGLAAPVIDAPAAPESLPALASRLIDAHTHLGVLPLAQWPERVASLPYYQGLLRNAFGQDRPSGAELAQALAAFWQATQDESLQPGNTGGPVLSGDPGNAGKVTMGEGVYGIRLDCNGCHGPLKPSDQDWGSNENQLNGAIAQQWPYGLLEEFTQTSGGVKDARPLSGKRLRPPFLKDQSLQSLDQVLDHHLAPGGPLDGKRLEAREREALLVFLNQRIANNPGRDARFTNPFKR